MKLVRSLLIAILHLSSQVNRVTAEAKRKIVQIPGDLVLGGLFPMHEQEVAVKDFPCGEIKEEKGIQRMEAMLYALDEINSDQRILPNLSLGAVVLDTCSNPSYALEQAMEFVRAFMDSNKAKEKYEGSSVTNKTNSCSPHHEPSQPVAGVIGAAFSGVSIMVANILKLFKIPQISYASTSLELSDKSRFEYFSRVVPPDNFQAQAMVEIVKQLGWTYVSTLAAQGEYGEKGISSFIQLAKKSGVCIAVSVTINRNADDEEFDDVVETLLNQDKARAVILFVDEDKTRKLLGATVRKGVAGKFYWIGSDSWGAKIHPVRDQEWAAEGAITILPKRNSIEGFDKYFLDLKPSKEEECSDSELRSKKVNCRNPWFRQFWSKHHRCQFDGRQGSSQVACTRRENMTRYQQEGLVPFVIDAVYAMAHSLHNLVLDVCCNNTHLYTSREEALKACIKEGKFIVCDQISPAPDGQLLLDYIRNTKFTSIQGNDIGDVKFNSDGDGLGRYSVYQYQHTEAGGWEYNWIGEFGEKDNFRWDKINKTEFAGVFGLECYKTQELYFELEMAKWNVANTLTKIPESVCSRPCPMGQIKNFETACCWTCVPCREDSIVAREDLCLKCPHGFVSNYFKDTCIAIQPATVSWLNPWAFFPLLLSSVGIILTVEVVSVFLVYNKVSVIMASGRELCYVLLLGILASYSVPFFALARPNIFTCTVLRIFNNSTVGAQKPKWISPRSQLAICSGLVSIQVVGVIIWLVLEPPGTMVRYMYTQGSHPRYVIMSVTAHQPRLVSAVETCAVSTFSLISSLVYNMILILLCTVYAVKTRKIPSNFNEAKYIGFTMYSTCIVWLAFIPIFFGTNHDYTVQISSLVMCVTVSASVALALLFGPKMYLVLLHPEKCARNYPGNKKPNNKPLKFSKSRESNVTFLECEENNGNNGIH